MISYITVGVLILAVFFFLRTNAKEKRRRETGRKLFLKAQGFQVNERYEEAHNVLHFIHWDLGGKIWFENFLDTDKVVTREAFTDFNKFLLAKIRADDARFSDEELSHRINRIQELTTPPEDFDVGQVVSEATEKFWASRREAK